MTETRYFNPTPWLLAFGLLAFGLAGLSIVDTLLPRPYDGVVLDTDSPDGLTVREVVSGSGADRAGIRRGDRIRGIGRSVVNNAADAARKINKFRIGDEVPYMVVTPDSKLVDYDLRLTKRQVMSGTYLYSTVLGFAFFLVGLFVLVRQPTLRASQVFFLLCGFFLLFLVCRMRPPSYSSVDSFILGMGTIAFLFLPAAFLHFYLIFPRPALLEEVDRRVGSLGDVLELWRFGWPVLYFVPPGVFVLSYGVANLLGSELRLLNGAPVASWVLLVLYMLLGLAALWGNSRHLSEPRQRRGVALVLVGSLFGLVPFLAASLFISQHSRTFFFFGIAPLVLVPITFTYAIVRFQLLDIQVILRRSLLYTVTSALVTGLYAGGIATFNAFFADTELASSRYFPILLALAIVLLFEPLRRRLQELTDRYFYAGRSRLQKAMVELGEAMTAQLDLQAVVQELVERLPQLLGLSFAALYLQRGGRLARVAGPPHLPAGLPDLPEMRRALRRRSRLTRIEQLGPLALRSMEVAQVVEALDEAGVEVLGDLASPRRPLGLVLLSGKVGQMPLEAEELELLRGLLHQAALALETSLLLEERTQQAELERELQIAASIQAQLLPESLCFAEGWGVAAVCRPARVVGGDFYSQLPSVNGNTAVVFGDVSGKSVSGALMMMAAHEALHALAMTPRSPSELFRLTNRRLYGIGRRRFVALGYFSATSDGRRLTYLVAGQPPPLLRRTDGTVVELPLPEHRIPVGALPYGDYQALEVDLAPGEAVLGYSDGVTDSQSPEGELFGYQRLGEALRESRGNPQEIVDKVLAAVEAFTGKGLQYDDLTLVAVGRQDEDAGWAGPSSEHGT